MRYPYFAGAFIATGIALASLTPCARAAEQSPSQLVQANSQQMVRALIERRTEFEAHPEVLHRYIRSEFARSFDRVYAARLVLGGSSRTASDADVKAFADALVDYLMDRYGSSLLEIHVGMGVRLVSDASLREGTIVKVRTLVDRTNGAPLQVDYLVHRNAGEWQVFDVIVEGISFVQTFRSVFGEVLHTKSVADITSDLRSGRIAPAATPIDRAIRKP